MDTRSLGVQDEEQFKYSPLESKDDIRLVTLSPAWFHEPIDCKLFHTKLKPNIPYEALSYTWGNHENTISIKVNGKSFGITHNLSTALRYLRRKQEVTLWIDALCINQKNDKERARQVALMTKIYHQAQRVHIWLGPAADDSEMVMELFKNFAEEPMKLVNEPRSTPLRTKLARFRSALGDLVSWPAGEAYWPSREIDWQPGEMDRSPHETDGSPDEVDWSSDEEVWSEDSELSGDSEPIGEPIGEVQWLKSYLMGEKRVRLRRALDALLEREYWYRAWIIQEILMARRISLNCGLSSVSWGCVTTVLKAFMDELHHDLHSSGSKKNDYNSVQARAMNLARLETVRYLASVRLDERASRGPGWLLEMLLKSRQFKAKDPRDRIFSLLGLINGKRFQTSLSETPILSVDYSLKFSEVSTKLFKYCVLAPSHFSIFTHKLPDLGALKAESMDREFYKGSLNILSASQPTNRPEGFPSWLPDFSRDNGMERWPCFAKTQYAIFEDPGPRFSPYNSTLEVYGVVVTSLRKGHVTDRRDDPEATDDPCLVTRVWNSMILAEMCYPPTPATSDFWATLQLGKNNGRLIRDTLCNSFDDEQRNVADSKSLLRALKRGIREQNGVVVSFLNNFRRGSLYRRFAIMRIEQRLYPAMIPAESRPGDELLLLKGSDYPVLLRPIYDEKNGFKFVGPCCIPGWHVQKDPSSYGLVQRMFLS